MRMLAPFISTIMIFLTPGLVLAQEGQATCIGCMALPANPTQQAAQIARNTVLSDQAGIITAQHLDYWGIGKVCSKFANANGFGPYGKVISDTMTPETHPSLYEGTDDLVTYCKSFPLFDNQQKENFYTYLTAHLAYAESSCNPNVGAAGPNGRAQGLVALHKNREPIYTAKEQFSNKCKRGDSLSADKSLRCGLAMLEGQFSIKSALFSRTGYWGPFTPQTRKQVTIQLRDPKNPKRRLKSKRMNANKFIKTAIQMYPSCK